MAVCSPLKTVVVNQPRIVGERINPTGKKRFKQALIENDMDYILGQAIEQIEGGADILDVNVGLPQIDEREMMIKTIKALQSIVDVAIADRLHQVGSFRGGSSCVQWEAYSQFR